MSECLALSEKRCLRQALGPLIGRWNKYLEHKFPLGTRRDSATSFSALFKRVFVDQVFMAPIGVCPRLPLSSNTDQCGIL